jgi:hypothetical protein
MCRSDKKNLQQSKLVFKFDPKSKVIIEEAEIESKMLLGVVLSLLNPSFIRFAE